MFDTTSEVSIEPNVEIEADGFITRQPYLERTGSDTAKPMTKCVYPKCEDCDKYHGSYCTVPMVVTKQLWLLTDEKLCFMGQRLKEIEDLVYDYFLDPPVKSFILRDSVLQDPPEIKITECKP